MEAQALGTASGKTSVMVAAVGAGASRTSVPSVPSAPASTALGCTDLGNGRNTADAALEMPLICLSCCLTIRSPTRIAVSSAEVIFCFSMACSNSETEHPCEPDWKKLGTCAPSMAPVNTENAGREHQRSASLPLSRSRKKPSIAGVGIMCDNDAMPSETLDHVRLLDRSDMLGPSGWPKDAEACRRPPSAFSFCRHSSSSPQLRSEFIYFISP